MTPIKNVNGNPVTDCRSVRGRPSFTNKGSDVQLNAFPVPTVDTNSTIEIELETSDRHTRVFRGWGVFGLTVVVSVIGCLLLGIVVWWCLLS